MDYKNTHFPQYKKLKNGLRFYKINSLNEFEEVQLLGEKVYHFTFFAEQYPEKLRIMDMLDVNSEHYQSANETNWLTLISRI